MPEPEQWHKGGKRKPEKINKPKKKSQIYSEEKMDYQDVEHQKYLEIRRDALKYKY